MTEYPDVQAELDGMKLLGMYTGGTKTWTKVTTEQWLS